MPSMERLKTLLDEACNNATEIQRKKNIRQGKTPEGYYKSHRMALRMAKKLDKEVKPIRYREMENFGRFKDYTRYKIVDKSIRIIE